MKKHLSRMVSKMNVNLKIRGNRTNKNKISGLILQMTRNIFIFLLTGSLIFMVASLHSSPIQSAGLAEQLNLELGEGSAEIADEIYYQLDGRADLFLYEAYQAEGEEEAKISTIMFLVELDDGFEIHNLPLRTILSREEVEKLAVAVNSDLDVDYVKLNLSYFIDVIDLYGEVEVETARGPKKMDREAARRYLEEGPEDEEDYEFDRVQRQEQILWAIREEMNGENGLPRITGLISIFYRGLRDIDTSLGLLRGLSLGVNFIRESPDNVAFYQPDAPEFGY